MVKVLPWPGCDSTQIRPPWASTRMRLMYKPRPRPGGPVARPVKAIEEMWHVFGVDPGT